MTLPFPALVGLELAQQALLLLAIDPELRGVVLAAPAGTGKTSLARGLNALLDVPFIELPASIDTENLLGGLDLQATLRTGHITLQQGALARAHGGIAYIDGINLMTDASANLLLSALDEGEVRIEREGLSRRELARFMLIGSYDPAEGTPRAHLLDRLAMIVPLPGQYSALQREMVVRHHQYVNGNWQEDTDFLRGLIITAREHLPTVTIEPEQVARLSQTALAYGVEGHRVDLFAIRVACAAAAYELRDSVSDEDCTLAAQLVILPRARQIPMEDAPNEPPPPKQDNDQPPEQPQPESSEAEGETQQPLPSLVSPEQILEALATDLPDALEQLPFINVRRGRTGSRGATEGNRGRHIRSTPGDPKRHRIDVVATLRAAAPWQPIREIQNGKRRVNLQASDIRVKHYRSKAGTLFCFAVDASGSMALHRMRQAKGAVHILLEKAYVNRDRVALIAFRGEQAELLMPPTQSVELARRALDLLPTGGGTPLGSALLLAADVAANARSRGIMQTVVILLTDGRGNVALHPNGKPADELAQLGVYLQESGLHTVVVDTKRNYLSRGEARQLAESLGGDYAYLPNANSDQIADLAQSVTS